MVVVGLGCSPPPNPRGLTGRPYQAAGWGGSWQRGVMARGVGWVSVGGACGLGSWSVSGVQLGLSGPVGALLS